MKITLGVSSCLIGNNCNFNGKNLLSEFVLKLSKLNDLEIVHFCPENSTLGTPRENLRIVGGDGYDVLSGQAQVLNQKGFNVTELVIQGANLFLELVKQKNIQHVIFMEGSPSCGSHLLLSEENWPQGGFKKGSGVVTALFRKNGIHVFSSFDEKSISEFIKSLGCDVKFENDLLDLKDFPKFKSFF